MDRTNWNLGKSNINLLYLKDIHVGAANILKQDALSIGADLAVPQGVIVAKEKYVDAILVGTTKHFKLLSKKEKTQPFGLQELSFQLKSFINNTNNDPTKGDKINDDRIGKFII